MITLLLSLSCIAYTATDELKKVYYDAEGNIDAGFRLAGPPLRIKPIDPVYAISYEDKKGKRQKLEFFLNNELVERKVFTEDKITYVEGKHSYSPDAWFEAYYNYRKKGLILTEFIQEIDHRIYKNNKKKSSDVIHREITKFQYQKKGEKIINLMYRRDFLPGNKLDHFWLFVYKTIEEDKPFKILEYDFNGKLIRVGFFKREGNREKLIFVHPSQAR